MTVRRLALGLSLGAAFAAWAPRGAAQIAPNAHWRTLRTPHFYVHFTPAEEQAARRAAVDAEQAYAALAQRLHPPRGPIDLVVADNVDFSNGSTTPYPTNRILVYARPGLDIVSLRYYDDWLQLVITHELTHVFHLDRTRGWWRLAQHVFGRAPFLFPNQYEPSWITEGLAVFYESDITGSGRVDGTYERMLLTAGAMDGGPVMFDRWNLATTRFPGGDLAYGYGALFFEHLSHARGPAGMRAYVESASGKWFPWQWDGAAHDAFGISFSNAWRAWHDSLGRHAPRPSMPTPDWRDLTHSGAEALYPRWVGDTAVLYTRADWRSSPAAQVVDTAGASRRLGRRNGNDANSPAPDGSIVYSQLEYTDPYHIRSDLYRQVHGHETRLTHNARLGQPDVRRDGVILAVRYLPATTQLVRVTPNGRTIAPITMASLDTEWAEPRWSPDGRHIAATRWTRGGYADVVVLDTLGRVTRAFTHDRAIDGTPAWTPDGRAVVFTSDRTGVTQVYVADLEGDTVPRRFTQSPTGVYYPSISPNGKEIAAARYADNGWYVGVAPFDTSGAKATPLDPVFDPEPMPAPVADTARATPYTAWRSVLPRFWLPLAGQTAHGNYSLGAFTAGNDVVGRHSYFAQFLADPRGQEHTWDVRYSYSGLGQPVINAEGFQDYDEQFAFRNNGTFAGRITRRAQTYTLGMMLIRPRIRDNAFVTLQGELEQRHYTSDPAPLLDSVDTFFRSDKHYWSIVSSIGWANTQYPVRAISFEDGIAFAATGQLKWLEGAGPIQSKSVSAVFDAYKSMNLGGFAHEVLAARLAGGIASGADPGVYDIGGSNGTPVSVFPGFTLGSRHTFAVRGFPAGIRSGDRVLAGSLEYRVPFLAPHRGLGFWPAFLDRTSINLFTDAGTTWNRGDSTFNAKPIASAGAELEANLGLQYDAPYIARAGIAFPYINNSPVKVSPASVYFEIGFAF